MHPSLVLTPEGRLLARRRDETPDGIREEVIDITDKAHHRLDDTVLIQAGARLSSIFELREGQRVSEGNLRAQLGA